jgi:hypothetical protein|tara:strand:+ start:232 stop:486 length:255 start_codon:yes stop_codon:yes gene_type:complete
MQDMILFKKILSARYLFRIANHQNSVTMLLLIHTGDLLIFPQELREGGLAPHTRKSLSGIIFVSYNNEPFFTIYKENETKIMSR